MPPRTDTPIDWDAVFPWMVANAATAAQAATQFGINPSTVRPAVKHERAKPSGGRLAGHPTLPPTGTAAEVPPPGTVATPAPVDPATAAAVFVPVSALVPWARNPRRHGEADAIAAAIIRWGFGTPLLARLADREIIAGHGRITAVLSLPKRYAALTRAAEDTDPRHARIATAARDALATWHAQAVALATDPAPALPVRYMDLSEDEAHALALADNEVARATGWDEAALSSVLRDFRARSVSTVGLGWDPARLAALTGDATAAPGRRSRLPAGDRSAVRKVTIELLADDATLLRRALDVAKGEDDPVAPEHERTNGRRLARICRAYLDARGA